MPDAFDLQRFFEAQAAVYAQVCAELRRGRKTTHWMWFVFPQVAGLGLSPMAGRYAIGSAVEARLISLILCLARGYGNAPLWCLALKAAPRMKFSAVPMISNSARR